jgi:hypothetical protein
VIWAASFSSVETMTITKSVKEEEGRNNFPSALPQKEKQNNVDFSYIMNTNWQLLSFDL